MSMLVDVSSGSGAGGVAQPASLTALGCSCLLALAVARGEAELILAAVAELSMCDNVLHNMNVMVSALWKLPE